MRVVAVFVVVVLLAGVVAAAAHEGDDTTLASSERPTTTTTVPAEPGREPAPGGGEPAADAPGAAPGEPGDTGGSGSTAGSAAPATGPATTAAPRAAGAGTTLAAPDVGTYRYRVTTTGGEDGDRVEEQPVRVEPDPSGGDGVRRRTVFETEMGTATDLGVWRPDRVVSRQTDFTTDVGSFSCDWEPDLLRLQAPLDEGASWSFDSTCTAETGFGPLVLRRSGTTTVGGRRTVDVGGSPAEVVELERRVETWITSGGYDHHEDARETELFDAGRGIAVRITSESTSEGSVRSRTMELLALEPS